MNSKRILIIDDDDQVVEIVSRQLEDLGYAFDRAADGQSGLEMALENSYSLVIVDIGLPKLGGLEVCRQLRAERELLPILVLTGESGETTAVLTLELGADEFITKPLQPLEFRARVRALLRRSTANTLALEKQTENTDSGQAIFVLKDLAVDMNLRKVSFGETAADLTSSEFDLLLLFINNQGRVLSREEIVELLWGHASYSYERNVRTSVSRLRTKLEAIGKRAPYIVTKRGFGYRLAQEDE